MNGDDILARASRAVRERAREPSTQVSRTRARVLLRASRRAQRGKLVLSLAPLAAVFAISTAWASTHGELPRAWDRVRCLLASKGGGTSAPAKAGIVAAVDRPVETAATGGAPADLGAAIAPAPPELSIDALPRCNGACVNKQADSDSSPPSSPRPEGSAQGGPQAVRAAVTAEARSAVREEDREGDTAASLYAEAHRAHFVDGDPSSALRAWNAYLAAAPEGPFVPEARYNRALTLVRLGRLDEARRALEPFASGIYGGYRTREAAALLDALARRVR
jgi:hypothetical protein